MSVDTLRDELLSLPGVADAEIDAEIDGVVPANVRVRLQPEADPRQVGAEVQRLLAARGMRSRVTGDGADPAPAAVPPIPLRPRLAPAAAAPIPPRPTSPPPVPEAIPLSPSPTSAPPDLAVVPAPPTSGIATTLASLTVEESAGGVTIVATGTDGRRFSQHTAAVEDAVANAVVAAVGALVEGRPPRLLATMIGAAEGSEVVTVLVERLDGVRLAGAALVAAGRPYAIARATWAALRSV